MQVLYETDLLFNECKLRRFCTSGEKKTDVRSQFLKVLQFFLKTQRKKQEYLQKKSEKVYRKHHKKTL